MPPSPGFLSKLDDVIARLGKFKPIRAYHGSPHSFSRFDASKIGTGEGAQAYGHGLYFAGREGTARQYRDKLTEGRDVLIGGVPSAQYLHAMPKKGSMEGLAVSALQEFAPEAIDLDDLFDSARTWMPDEGGGFARALESIRRKGVSLARHPGHMYEVEIGHPEQSLLDWDATIVGQRDHLQKVWDAMRGQWDAEKAAAIRLGVRYSVPANAEDVLADMQRNPAYTGKALWNTAAGQFGKRSAASILQDAGVPGIRYLDQGSRSAGEGTRNYVIFPGAEDAITILRKYGLLPPVAGAAMMSGEDEEGR